MTAGGVLSAAFEIMKEAKTVLDSPRYYYRAGLLFDKSNMHDRAAQCYKKATKLISSILLVDEKMAETPASKLKFRSMNNRQQRLYLSTNSDLRRTYIVDEENRQRLRILVSHIQLTRLNIIVGDYPSAYESLCKSIEQCNCTDEHVLVLQFMHALLSEMSVRKLSRNPPKRCHCN